MPGEVDACQVEELTKLHRRLQSKHGRQYLVLLRDTKKTDILLTTVSGDMKTQCGQERGQTDINFKTQQLL